MRPKPPPRPVRVVGYCTSCRFQRRHAEEADTLDLQLRFGRCRLGVRAPLGLCDAYEPRRPPGGR